MASIKGASVQPGQLTEQQQQTLVQPGQAAPSGDTLSRIIAEQLGRAEPEAAPAPAPDVAPAPVAEAPQVSAQQIGEPLGEAFGQLEEQRERERVPTIKERLADETTVDRWDQRQGKQVDTDLDDGGLRTRAKAVSEMVSSGAWTPAIGIGTETKAALQADPNADLAALEAQNRQGEIQGALQAAGAVVNTPSASGLSARSTIDPQFLQLATAVVENHFADQAFAKDQVDPNDIVEQNFGTVTADQAELELGKTKKQGAVVTKASNNKQIGQEIYREYQRVKNAAAGRPTDQYQDISPDNAVLLGDLAKESYAAAFGTGPDALVKRFVDSGTGQVVFQPTPKGLDAFNASSPFRGKMFPRKHVRTSKTPLTAGKQIGEGKTYTKTSSGKLGAVVDDRQVNEAIRNLGQVANVVNKQRLTLAAGIVMPALAANPQDPNLGLYRELSGFGQSKVNKFEAAGRKAAREGDTSYDPQANMARLEDKIAQELYGLFEERNGANYLTYGKQAFNSRIAPQQSRFNPTSSKLVRFATTNVIPAHAVKGNQVYKNLQQMYAMMLVPDADVALPKVRVEMLKAAAPEMVRDGLRLQQLLHQADPDGSKTEAAAQAVLEGKPLNQIDFPTIPFDPVKDEALMKKIQKKGADDGLAYMDGLIDFAKFQVAMDAGRPYDSFFNTYIDGKTNGLAANGIQMGNYETAAATGVVRTNNTQLLDDGDLRDQLRDDLIGALQSNGIPGDKGSVANEYYQVAEDLFGSTKPHLKGISRQLHKTTTMTFGYGKDIDAFAYDMADTIEEMVSADRASGDGSFADAWEKIATDGPTGIDDFGNVIQPQALAIQAYMRMYAPALEGRMSDDALNSRSLMRGAAVANSLMNELMFIESYTGEHLYYGGSESLGWAGAEVGEYKVNVNGKPVKMKTAVYGTETTSSAIREVQKTDPQGNPYIEKQVGQDAYGGSVPGPVQSLDAATVIKSASGKSWGRLRNASKGNPYLHTIYDAFKLDAMGYDVMLKEINDNWLNAAMDWSYLEATLKGMEANAQKFNDKLKARNPNEVVDASITGEARQAGVFLTPTVSAKGTTWYPDLTKRIQAVLPHNAEFEQAWDIQMAIIEDMKKAGWSPNEPLLLTVKQWRELVVSFNKRTHLRRRLTDMIEHTNKKKKELRSKIGKEGPNYQYYAH